MVLDGGFTYLAAFPQQLPLGLLCKPACAQTASFLCCKKKSSVLEQSGSGSLNVDVVDKSEKVHVQIRYFLVVLGFRFLFAWNWQVRSFDKQWHSRVANERVEMEKTMIHKSKTTWKMDSKKIRQPPHFKKNTSFKKNKALCGQVCRCGKQAPKKNSEIEKVSCF